MTPKRLGALGTKWFVQDEGVQTETVGRRVGGRVPTSKGDWLSKLLRCTTELRDRTGFKEQMLKVSNLEA